MRMLLPLFGMALVLTGLADYLLFGHALGCGVTVFAAALAAALWVRYGRRLAAGLPWAGLWGVVALGASLQSSVIGVMLLIALTWAAVAMALYPKNRDIFEATCAGTAGGVGSLPSFFADLGRRVMWGGVHETRYAAAWVVLLPVVIIALFAAIIIPANLVLQEWTQRFWANLIEWLKKINAARVFFWAVVCLESYGLMRFRPWLGQWRRRRRPGRIPAAPPALPAGFLIVRNPITPEMRSRYESLAAIVTLAGLNVLFLAANAADAAYLWLALKLPEGLTYARYAQEGSYRLIVAVVLAAVTITAFFRIGAPQSERLKARVLAYIFILQNAVVLLGAGRRLQLYVTAYGLTRFRVAAFLWMLLVLAGFVTIVWKLAGRKPFRFLLRANTAIALIVLCAASITNIDGFIAGWNVARYRDGSHGRIDVGYLRHLGSPAMGALATLADSSDPIVSNSAGNALAFLIERARDRDEHWQSRTIRNRMALDKALEEADKRGIAYAE